MKKLLLVLCALATLALPSCSGLAAANSAVVAARDAALLAEARGDWYVGRRYFTSKCRYWGYVRRPGQTWDKAVLVVMDEEKGVRNPDRLPESPSGSEAAHGYDHNFEYRVWGTLQSRLIYDPNADMELPTFTARKFELTNSKPGFLFKPSDSYKPEYIPAREARRQTPSRL